MRALPREEMAAFLAGLRREKEQYPQWAMDLVAMFLTSFHVALTPFIVRRCKPCLWSEEDGAWRSAPRPS